MYWKIRSKYMRFMTYFGISILLFFLTVENVISEEVGTKKEDEKVEACPKDMVHVSGGMVCCKKGTGEEKKSTLIYLEEFCIDRFEYPNKKGEKPSIKVTWFEAKVYCKKKGKRLCSGEEWEKACAGKNWYKYSYSDSYDASKCGLGRKTTKDVYKAGSLSGCVSSYGVYDMIGNVWEWTDDPYNKNYVKRGGYINADAKEANCFIRKGQSGKTAGIHDGFRCCKDVSIDYIGN